MGALIFICDAVKSNVVNHKMKVVNNIGVTDKFSYPGFEIVEVEKLSQEDLNKVNSGEESLLLGAVMPETKRKLVALFHLEYESLFNKNRAINNWENIGDGCLVDAMVTIAGNAKIGNYVTIYCNSSINHDCEIGDYVTLCPNVTVCGNVKIGEGTFVGAGSVIKNGVTIGENCVIGCGSVVIRDVEDGQTVYGNPARAKI